MVDLPFALPTAVAGIALTALYAPNGWIGGRSRAARHQGRLHAARHRRRADLHRPALRGAHRSAGADRPRREIEEAAATPRRQPLADLSARHPAEPIPALLTGLALAFARALGEYGSVIFIAGNMPIGVRDRAAADRHPSFGSTITPAPPRSRVVMLVASFLLLLRGQPAPALGAKPHSAQRLTRSIEPTRYPSAARRRSRTRARPVRACCRGRGALPAVPGAAAGRGVREAFPRGRRYFDAFPDPDALAAIRLTLLVAAIAVPLNLVFGMAAAWAIAKFEFPRQERC